MRNRLLFAALVAALLGAAGRARAAEGPELTAEDKVLNRFLGSWRSSYKFLKTEATPEEKKGTAEITFARVLGNKFVQERRTHSDKTTNLAMYTYDPEKKTYGAWWFSSAGQAAAFEGKWDADTRTMTWTSGEEKLKTTVRNRFVTDNTIEWDVLVKEKNKVLLRLEGKSTRAVQFR